MKRWLLILMAAATLTACTLSDRAEDFTRENPDGILREIREEFNRKTNFNQAEAEAAWNALTGDEPDISCRRHPDWRIMALERRETAETCTIRMRTSEPVLLDLEAGYQVYFAIQDTRHRDYPIIEGRLGKVRILGFRQGILAGQERKAGAWSLPETDHETQEKNSSR